MLISVAFLQSKCELNFTLSTEDQRTGKPINMPQDFIIKFLSNLQEIFTSPVTLFEFCTHVRIYQEFANI